MVSTKEFILVIASSLSGGAELCELGQHHQPDALFLFSQVIIQSLKSEYKNEIILQAVAGLTPSSVPGASSLWLCISIKKATLEGGLTS